MRARTDRPLAAGDHAEPVPDIAVITDALRHHKERHPDCALLVVELAAESLYHDRTVKQRIYARRGIDA